VWLAGEQPTCHPPSNVYPLVRALQMPTGRAGETAIRGTIAGPGMVSKSALFWCTPNSADLQTNT
jgi:hypothetical protein